MIVCICNNLKDQSLVSKIKEAPIYPSDPYLPSYRSTVDQIYDYLEKNLTFGDQCGNCKIFVRQVIIDYLNSDSNT